MSGRGAVHRGLSRHLLLVVDLSRSVNERESGTTLHALLLRATQAFIVDFFDANPLSQLAVVALRDGLAERLTELSGSPSRHIRALASASIGGDCSLLNGLLVATAALRTVPKHSSREVLVVYASLHSCDPSPLDDLLGQAHDDGPLSHHSFSSFLPTIVHSYVMHVCMRCRCAVFGGWMGGGSAVTEEVGDFYEWYARGDGGSGMADTLEHRQLSGGVGSAALC